MKMGNVRVAVMNWGPGQHLVRTFTARKFPLHHGLISKFESFSTKLLINGGDETKAVQANRIAYTLLK